MAAIGFIFAFLYIKNVFYIIKINIFIIIINYEVIFTRILLGYKIIMFIILSYQKIIG